MSMMKKWASELGKRQPDYKSFAGQCLTRNNQLENEIRDINRELDRMEAPKVQESGFSYSTLGRLKALNSKVIGSLANQREIRMEYEIAELKAKVISMNKKIESLRSKKGI